jgi:hypothetical protein
MSPNYKFHYFDVRGLGEVTRMIFAQASILHAIMEQVLKNDCPAKSVNV